MKIKNIFKEIFGGRKEKIDYPYDFAIITFSEVSFENGVKGDSNKIIKRYFYDSLGNLRDKTYKYSPERVYSFREVLGIPTYDKTEKELEFPIVGKIELGVLKYKVK